MLRRVVWCTGTTEPEEPVAPIIRAQKRPSSKMAAFSPRNVPIRLPNYMLPHHTRLYITYEEPPIFPPPLKQPIGEDQNYT